MCFVRVVWLRRDHGRCRLNTALINATRSDNAAEVRRLLALGADANATGVPVFDEGAWQQLVQFLHGHRVNLPVSAINVAIAGEGDAPFADRDQLVRLLLDAGASPDEPDEYGAPPLLRYADSGDASMVSVFLRHGANPNARDNIGRTALMLGARSDKSGRVLETLLKAGARFGDTNAEGRSALDFAIDARNLSGMRMLLLWSSRTQR